VSSRSAREHLPFGTLVALGLLLALGLLGATLLAADLPADPAAREAHFAIEREKLVQRALVGRGIKDAALLEAFRTVPRHCFVPEEQQRFAYDDRPLFIGHEQTISQPYVVAVMIREAAVEKGDRVLEVGTGSGYGAAILSALGCEVYSIEIVKPLCRRAAATLKALGHDRVEVRCGDGYAGWPGKAPFDAIVITAQAPRVPEPLLDQLEPGGRMVLPLGGDDFQDLIVVEKNSSGEFATRTIFPVTFVPMTGRIREPPR